MGKVLSVLQRRANRFNVDNRAAKVISKEKPTPAPKYPSTLQEIEAIKSEYPTALEEQMKKDPVLDNRLKQVFVQSQDPLLVVEEAPQNPTRPLPQDRHQVDDFEFGFKEPNMIPQGRFTLKQAIKFIADHQTDPKTWTAAAIAKEYKIDQEKLEKVLHHFRAFQIHISEKKTGVKEQIKAIEEKQDKATASKAALESEEMQQKQK